MSANGRRPAADGTVPVPDPGYVAGMCGRARLSTDVSEIKRVFELPLERPTPNVPPSWNLAPADPLQVVDL